MFEKELLWKEREREERERERERTKRKGDSYETGSDHRYMH